MACGVSFKYLFPVSALAAHPAIPPGPAVKRGPQAALEVPTHLGGPVGQPSGAPRQTFALHSLSWGACATTASPALYSSAPSPRRRRSPLLMMMMTAPRHHRPRGRVLGEDVAPAPLLLGTVRCSNSPREDQRTRNTKKEAEQGPPRDFCGG